MKSKWLARNYLNGPNGDELSVILTTCINMKNPIRNNNHTRRLNMNNFIYSIPTTAYFGKGQINILGETIKAHGGSKVLLAYGGGSIKQNDIPGLWLTFRSGPVPSLP